jgi:hypothetical protein
VQLNEEPKLRSMRAGHLPEPDSAVGLPAVRSGVGCGGQGSDGLRGMRCGQQLFEPVWRECVHSLPRQLWGGELPFGLVHSNDRHTVHTMHDPELLVDHPIRDGQLHSYGLESVLRGADGMRGWTI